MASFPSSPEVLGQLIEGIRKTYYAAMSIMMMFIWDLGKATNCIFAQITPSMFYSLSVDPVISFDQEVSTITFDTLPSIFNTMIGGIYLGKHLAATHLSEDPSCRIERRGNKSRVT